jgi:hypothetical protein
MERRNATLTICVAVLLLVPILYVLSSGPAVWLTYRGYIPDGTEGPAARLYAPLLAIADTSEFGNDLLRRYWVLWLPDGERLHAY